MEVNLNTYKHYSRKEKMYHASFSYQSKNESTPHWETSRQDENPNSLTPESSIYISKSKTVLATVIINTPSDRSIAIVVNPHRFQDTYFYFPRSLFFNLSARPTSFLSAGLAYCSFPALLACQCRSPNGRSSYMGRNAPSSSNMVVLFRLFPERNLWNGCVVVSVGSTDLWATIYVTGTPATWTCQLSCIWCIQSQVHTTWVFASALVAHNTFSYNLSIHVSKWY